MLVVKYDSTVLSSDVSLKLKTSLPPYWCTISVNMACDPACNEFVVKKQLKEINKNRMLMLSEYAEKLDGNVKKRYVEKISEVGVNPALIPDHKLDPECFPPIEASDLLPYLVLDTSYYTNSLKTSVVYKLTTRWCLVSSVVFKELFFRKTRYCCQSQSFTKNERSTCHFVDNCQQRWVHFNCTLHWMHGRIRRMLFLYCQCSFLCRILDKG